MEGRNYNNKNNIHSNHLSLPQQETHEQHTIYKLRLSMKKSLSPQTTNTPSPQGSWELKNMFQRLVEIDTESRQLLIKVFSMLEKDDKLENYFKKRIEDPKVSRMWELVEQVLACQHELPNNNIDELVSNKGIMDRDEDYEELKLDRFRIRTLDTTSGGGGGGVVKDLETSVDHGKA
ncbi:hypothetical protein RND81_04G124300 [Saponaria officinalis]|uniref:Uncharacterized protein n=1 Tax=Saponaria officinalis TaxID=3572 RepID=A0AAW1LM99_SAPOF